MDMIRDEVSIGWGFLALRGGVRAGHARFFGEEEREPRGEGKRVRGISPERRKMGLVACN
jgi:hypothetical protein